MNSTKKDIMIIPARGPIEVPIVIKGGETPMLDEEGKQLIVMGIEGTYLTFNWDNILYYGVSEHDCDEHDDV